MPKRTDIRTILVIGAGPIVIGQACEFDYSGTQACKALKEEGYRVVLVNSNPATIMTDPETADRTYIEPITPEAVEGILEKERPDALLPTVGGQTALNCAMQLYASGALERYGVTMIGANPDAIDKAENRRRFNEAMADIGLEVPRNCIVSSQEEAADALKEIGLPAIIRPSFTLGGTGGGIAETEEQFFDVVRGGLAASPTNQVLIDESILGWKEYEMEVVRDKADNAIIICSIENIDPMGVHTGDSITVAPAMTLTDKEYQRMRDASLAVLREIGVETGGSNVQFAVNPQDGRMVVIEMNPRVSRSSALASKATGFPIAKIAAKLAVGYTLDELDNDVTKVTPASFEPTIDYIVTKIPRFTFEKFADAAPVLSSAMRSVGEAMSVGRSFAESLQKGLRSLETGLTGLNTPRSVPGYVPGDNSPENLLALLESLKTLSPDRLLRAAEALRVGFSLEKICGVTGYDPWFVDQIKRIVAAEQAVIEDGLPDDPRVLSKLKAMGFSDKRLAELTGTDEKHVREERVRAGVFPVFKTVDTCAAEFASFTAYYYSCYEPFASGGFQESETLSVDKEKIIILGGGPNRIGQGIEFDYACVHAAKILSQAGYETIMVNCNPETVSTDYDTAGRLYFEPLTTEDVLEVAREEAKSGTLRGALVQFGGQTPLKLSAALEEAGIPVLGTSPDMIDLAEDRDRFRYLLKDIGLMQPENTVAGHIGELAERAKALGYPCVVRPSNVLGGRAMEIVFSDDDVVSYIRRNGDSIAEGPILLDKFLEDAVEMDVDAISDGHSVYVAGVMEHIEEAGVHSGDSACVIPPYGISPALVEEIRDSTAKLAVAMNVKGLLNVQFAIRHGLVYVLEANPRASRTVPFVAKATGVPVAKIAALVAAGERLEDLRSMMRSSYSEPRYAVKEAVFPFARFDNTDTLLGPEMKSTGEVMGTDANIHLAYAKAQIGAGNHIYTEGGVFVSVRDKDKPAAMALAKKLHACSFTIYATDGTARFFRDNGLEDVHEVNKIADGGEHALKLIREGKVQLLINTDSDIGGDALRIRRTAFASRVPYATTMAGAKAITNAIVERRQSDLDLQVCALQDM